MNDNLVIAGRLFTSRLFLGTGKFASSELMLNSILESGTELVTMALKRIDLKNERDAILPYLKKIEGMNFLPNTSGARDAKEAIFSAELAREALNTNWIKLEIHPDPRYLMPDPVETLKATEELVKKGFIVLPYIHADPVLCKKIEDVGGQAVMPLGSPIGSNKGLRSIDFLKIIIEQSNIPVIVDAGIGRPSDASEAMEIGADAVLVNTAIAVSENPIQMSKAFKKAVQAGRLAYNSKIPLIKEISEASSPLTNFLE